MTPNQFCYHAYLACRILPHGERPTLLHVRIARQLARWSSSAPSHAKLARAVGCCVRTVQNALNRYRALGLLDWRHQRRLTRWSGWRRLANAYLFVAPFSLSAVPAKEGRRKAKDPKSIFGKLPPEALLALSIKWGLA